MSKIHAMEYKNNPEKKTVCGIKPTRRTYPKMYKSIINCKKCIAKIKQESASK